MESKQTDNTNKHNDEHTSKNTHHASVTDRSQGRVLESTRWYPCTIPTPTRSLLDGGLTCIQARGSKYAPTEAIPTTRKTRPLAQPTNISQPNHQKDLATGTAGKHLKAQPPERPGNRHSRQTSHSPTTRKTRQPAQSTNISQPNHIESHPTTTAVA